MKGGSLKIKEIRTFLEASYNPDAPKNIFGYSLDENFSSLYGKVYVNEVLKKVVLSFRGTVETSDWANNLIYAANSSAYRLTPRFKEAQKMATKAVKRYKGYKIYNLGHSQGALLAHLNNSDKIQNVIELNPAYKDEDIAKNEYIIRSSSDLVSSLTVPKKYMNNLLYTNWSKSHLLTIPAKSSNPLTEHKVDVLSRLDPEKKIGKGGYKKQRVLTGYIIHMACV